MPRSRTLLTYRATVAARSRAVSVATEEAMEAIGTPSPADSVSKTTPPAFPFFVGRGRSGTTLLLAMFDSRSDMAVPYESRFAVSLGRTRGRYERGGLDVERFLADLAIVDGFRGWNLPIEQVRDHLTVDAPRDLPAAIRAVYAAYAAAHGKPRYAEKSPGFVMHVPLLAGLFPEARFVHIIRDGRDVALSYRASSWGTKDIAESAYYWRRFVTRGRETGRRLGPERYREVRYEQLVDDPELIVRDLCVFMDLSFEPEMLRYFERAGSVLGKIDGPWQGAHGNLSRPPTSGMRDWRREMPRDEQLLFDALAGDLLHDLGYPRAAERIPARVRLEAHRRSSIVHARRARGRLGSRR